MRDFRKKYRRRRAAAKIALILLFLAMAALTAGGIGSAVALKNLPAPEELFSRRVVQSTKIFDRTGTILLYEIHGEEKRTVVPYAEIPAAVKNATVAVEDANFWRHAGIDFKGIARALLTDIALGSFRQGGSTITQQLVKNSLLGRERTIKRKVKEALLAVALEARLPKEEILNLYLNQIPYGSNAYGIEAAARTFFGKRARDLAAAESAILAALPAAPSYYSPYGQHKDELLKRKDKILERMQELGYLSPDEAERAKKDPLNFLAAPKNIRAPHFVMFVRDYLIERYGEEEVGSGGLIVKTTLDWELQQKAEEIVQNGAKRNEELIKAANMALVAMNPKSGDILAMVGSSGWTSEYLAEPFPERCAPGINCRLDPYVNSALRLRQPGSAFKPFVYAAAFKKGFTPETVLFDVPTEFNPQCAPEGRPRPGANLDPEDCYHPQNYDEKFRGPVTLRQAIAQSLNVPSVKVLYLAGVEDSIRTAEDMGISSLGERERFGLSLVLGGAEVSLLEMTSAFGAFANDGVLSPPTAILKVEAADGRILEEKRDQARPVIDPETARLLNDVLSDNEARIPVFQPRSSLYFPDRKVAAKTGTTQEFRDAWTIGYTPAISVGVWAGNNDNSAMRQKGSGVMAAAPSWHAFMEYAIPRFPEEEFMPPLPSETLKPVLKGIWQGDAVITIDSISKKRATDLTPPETRQDAAFGEPHDPLFWIDRNDPGGPPPQDPASDPQYPNWESAFQAWLLASGFKPRPLASAPKDFDDVHVPEKQPRLTVQKKSGPEGTLIISVEVKSAYALKEAALFYQDKILMSRSGPASTMEFMLSQENLAAISGGVEIRVYDIAGNIGSALVTIP